VLSGAEESHGCDSTELLDELASKISLRAHFLKQLIYVDLSIARVLLILLLNFGAVLIHVHKNALKLAPIRLDLE